MFALGIYNETYTKIGLKIESPQFSYDYRMDMFVDF